MCAELPQLKSKLARTFEKWINKSMIPKYVKTARIIALSKDGTPYPSYGQIRPIAVLPAISKLLEQVVLEKLQAEMLHSATPLHFA